MPKDYNALCKTANPSKPCAPPVPSGHQSDLPPHHDCVSHSTYHANNSQCSSCWLRLSPTSSRSHSCSCDCHDNNHCKHCLLSNHHSHFVGHHDFLPPAKRGVVDIGNCEPVGYACIASEVLSHSEVLDHTAWHTNPGKNPYRPAHFDNCGNRKDPKTAFYQVTSDADYASDKTSHIINKPPAYLPPGFGTYNFTNPKTKNTATG